MKYYSDKTKKMYESVEELETAETKFDEEHKAELALKEERAAAAKEVEEAYKKANDAYAEARGKLNDFISKYGSFHRTFTSETPTSKSLFDVFFDNFWI